jgi:hypothetical protein
LNDLKEKRGIGLIFKRCKTKGKKKISNCPAPLACDAPKPIARLQAVRCDLEMAHTGESLSRKLKIEERRFYKPLC